MSWSETHIAQLLLKQISGSLTPEEAVILREWRALSPGNEQFFEDTLQPDALQLQLKEFEEAALQAAGVQAPQVHSVTQGKVRSMRFGWLRYAAVIIVFLGAGALLWSKFNKQEAGLAVVTPREHEMPSAGYKATLTLGDGSVITLDSSFSGTIAQQGNAAVVQTTGGEIRYQSNGLVSGAVMMNTMSTPRGGQYRLTLPDGTKIWLNAASSVSYPAAFGAGARNIKVSGEVYVEVAPDKLKPFFVNVDEGGSIEVLGTEFNINAYKDYGTIKTTLVSGKIKVAADKGGVLLAPGQQAIQDIEEGDAVRIADRVDLSQVLAWKNGVFDFTGASFQTLMKEVERWYDVNVIYERTIPSITFKGKMDRAVSLSGVIRFLNDYGVQTQLNGRTLIIKDK